MSHKCIIRFHPNLEQLRQNKITIRKYELKDSLEIPQVVEITKNWGLISRRDITKMLNMAQRNDISVDVFNKITLREDGRNK